MPARRWVSFTEVKNNARKTKMSKVVFTFVTCYDIAINSKVVNRE